MDRSANSEDWMTSQPRDLITLPITASDFERYHNHASAFAVPDPSGASAFEQQPGQFSSPICPATNLPSGAEETWLDFLRYSNTSQQPTVIEPPSSGPPQLPLPLRPPPNVQSPHVLPPYGPPTASHSAYPQRAALQESIRKRRIDARAADASPSRAKMSRSEAPGEAPRRHTYVGGSIQFPVAPEGRSFDSRRSVGGVEGPFTSTFAPRMSMPEQQPNFSLPRWQPDSEVVQCPVCGNQFGFFYRKHHCRKCGRVVCANCSPHRITMPHQYIVQPPIQIDLTGEEGNVSPQLATRYGISTLEGGEQVRVCNPCVPDPNFSPPPQRAQRLTHYAHGGLMRTHPEPAAGTYGSAPANSWQVGVHQTPVSTNGPVGADPFYRGTGLFPPPANPRRRSVLDAPLPPPPGFPQFGDQLAAPRTSSRVHRPHQSTGNVGVFPNQPLSQNNFLGRLAAPHDPGLPASQPIPVPRRIVAEEDECPVCGIELPAKTLDGSESERERHVEECIASHFTPSGPSRATLDERPDPTLPQNLPTGEPSAPDPLQRNPPNPSQPRQRRATGNRMLVYTATEKDCVADGGEAAECIICFEEFETGVELGRLECLCKFHRACIRRWWEAKGLGTCPTHQLHD